MRSTLAPPRDDVRAASADAQAGSTIFNNLGCNVCHTRTITTAAPGTLINGGALKVANALPSSTRNRVRTAALWGLRARGWFMHDASSFNLTDAIQRHGNQAASARKAFNALSSTDQDKLIAFLLSL